MAFIVVQYSKCRMQIFSAIKVNKADKHDLLIFLPCAHFVKAKFSKNIGTRFVRQI